MEREAKKRAGIPVSPEPEIPPEAELMNEDDNQFWNYRDLLPDEAGETPRWKYHYPRTRELFDWLPWGTRGKFREVQASPILLTDAEPKELQALGEAQVKLVETVQSEKENRPIDGNCRGLYDCLSCTMRLESFIEREMFASPILLAESDVHEIQTLGEPQMMILDSSNEVCVSAEDLSLRLASKAPVSIINAEIDYELREDPSFLVSMSCRSRRLNKKKSGSDSRGNQVVRPIPNPRFEGHHRPGESHFVGLDKREDKRSPKPWGSLHNEYHAPSPPLG